MERAERTCSTRNVTKTGIRYTIADIGFELLSEYPVRNTASFLPFQQTNGKTDIRIAAIPVVLLPKPQGPILYKNDEWFLSQEKTGKMVWFTGCEDHSKIYANRIRTGNEILIRYDRDYQHRYFSEDGSIFYHARFADMILPFDRMILHAAYIHTEWGGILFSGPSGIGKSTQAELWIRYHASSELINGDKPVVGFDGEQWKAYGSPFAGSSRCYKNESDPLLAMIMLEQSSTNRLTRLDEAEAFRQILRNAVIEYGDSAFVQKASELVARMVRVVPVYQLACTPDERAVRCLEKVFMKKEPNGQTGASQE